MLGLRKKFTPGKNKFSGLLTVIRKGHKMSAGLMARRSCKTHKTFVYIYMKHLILIKVRTADPHVTLFIPMCNKRYISKPQNKEIRSVSGKTDTPMSLLSCSLFFWLNSHLMHGYPPSLLILPGLLRLDRGGLSASSSSGERKDTCGPHR